jgi:hypothetical protein
MNYRFSNLTATTTRRLATFKLATLIALALVLFAASAHAQPLIYVVTLTQQFGTIDVANGQFNPIGKGTPDGLTNLIWSRDGSLLSLAISGSHVGSLVRINPHTRWHLQPVRRRPLRI